MLSVEANIELETERKRFTLDLNKVLPGGFDGAFA